MKPPKHFRIPLVAAVALTAWAITTTVRADFASEVLSHAPVGYWRFNETDPMPPEIYAANAGSFGTAGNGRYINVTRTQPGAIPSDPAGRCAVIPNANGGWGGSARVRIPWQADLNTAGAFSVEFWAKPAITSAIACPASSVDFNTTPRYGWLFYQGGPLLADGNGWFFRIYHTGTGGNSLAAVDLAIDTDHWYHVVGVYDGAGSIKLYVDGAVAATTPVDGTFTPNASRTDVPMTFGGRADGLSGDYGWGGQMDEVAYYTKALSDADVLAHYQAGRAATPPQPYETVVKSSGPAVYLRLDEPPYEPLIAVNSGTLGAAGNGIYQIGTASGLPGPRMPSVTGFNEENKAAGFNGISGSVTIPGLPINTDTVTMLCWLKRDGTQPARAGIMHNRKVSEPQVKATGLGFIDNGLGLCYNWEDHGEAYNFSPAEFVPPDQAWTFFAVTVEPEHAVMYMGTAAGLIASTNVYAHTAHDFSGTTIELGWDNYQTTRIYRGALDEFAMFDKALSYDQVKALFDAALPGVLSITRAPADPVFEGMSVTFQTGVAGSAPITYQWRKDGQNLAGQTGATLVLANAQVADSGSYDVVATAGGRELISEALALTVQTSPPIITQTPQSAVRFVNGTVTFQVAAIGSHPFTYQWEFNDAPIPGATGPALVMKDLTPADAGTYTVVITNPYGAFDASATLAILAPSKLAATATDLGPVGYWRLDETSGAVAYDYWGGRDGAVRSGATINGTGPVPPDFQGFDAENKAYSFNNSGMVEVLDPLNLNSATITIVAWIKPNGAQEDYDGLVFCRGGNTVAGLDYQTGGQIGYHWNDAAETYNFQSGMYPLDGVWNFVALVVEPTQATVYCDDGTGLYYNINTVNHATEEFNGTLRFASDSGTGRFFNGMIDDVVIYDRPLTEAEIASLNTAGRTGAYAGPIPATIVAQPKSDIIQVGAPFTLNVQATGSVPLTFQWQKDGADIPGAVRSSYALAAASYADAGTYTVKVSNAGRSVTSSPATLGVKPPPEFINLADGLVLHLKFDGDYQDGSGRGNHGTKVGEPVFVPGKLGQALEYNTITAEGVYNHVTLGTPADLAFGADVDFSVSMWVKYSGLPGDLPFISNTQSSMGGAGFTICPAYNQTGLWWGLNDFDTPAAWPGVGYQGDTASVLNDGQWHNIVVAFDRQGDATTYIDGMLKDVRSLAGTWNVTTGTPINIGQASGTYGEDGTFQIDDVGVWRRALSTYESQAIYTVGQKGLSFDTAGPVTITISKTDTGLSLMWQAGTLESADAVQGPYTPVAGAKAPYLAVPTSGTAKFYRVKL